MKGIILAAGKGTRLYPMTKPICKPLLPVYDKPLIYYPLSTLLQAGIKEVLIIIPSGEEGSFRSLLGDGKRVGISITYLTQTVAKGIADALRIGKGFIGNDDICLILGDNIFYHIGLKRIIEKAKNREKQSAVFGYWIEEPRPFGVIEFGEQGQAISIEEKPKVPKSNYIIPGLYFYDCSAIEIAEKLEPSPRGELEITDVNLEYLKRGELQVFPLEKDFIWFDAGSADSLFEAAATIRALQLSEGRYIGCIEEEAFLNEYITKDELFELGEQLNMTQYGKYLKQLL